MFVINDLDKRFRFLFHPSEHINEFQEAPNQSIIIPIPQVYVSF